MTRKILLLLIGGLLSLPTWAIQYSYDELHRLKRVQYDKDNRGQTTNTRTYDSNYQNANE